MKRLLSILGIVFVAAFTLSFYGASVLQNGEDDYSFYVSQNIFQDAAMWAALPGDLITSLVINPTDIPERNPDPWSIRWPTALVSSIFWILCLSIVWFVITFSKRILSRQPTERPASESY